MCCIANTVQWLENAEQLCTLYNPMLHGEANLYRITQDVRLLNCPYNSTLTVTLVFLDSNSQCASLLQLAIYVAIILN